MCLSISMTLIISSYEPNDDFNFEVSMGLSNTLRYLQQLTYDENICGLSIFKTKSHVLFRIP